MAKFPSEIKIPIFRSDRILAFKTTGEMKRWLKAEAPFWEGVNSERIGSNSNLKHYWEGQSGFYSYMNQKVEEFEKRDPEKEEIGRHSPYYEIKDYFSQISDGTVITSDCDIYPAIVNTAQSNPNAAAFLYVMARSDSERVLAELGCSRAHLPFRALLDLILLQAKGKGSKDWLLPQRKELAALRDESQAELDAIRKSFEDQAASIDEQKEQAQKAHLDREARWSNYKEKTEKEWGELKRVYDEKLALLAPTQYWNERAGSHKKMTTIWGISFGAALALSVALFVCLGMPRLASASGNEIPSLVLTLLPIAIPAFACLWALKILSRLFSENLQMMSDARERQTMVKTFLALMRDDTSGSPLIKGDDRILILHALFRPSSITAGDDSPPVHWFDILSNKFGEKNANT